MKIMMLQIGVQRSCKYTFFSLFFSHQDSKVRETLVLTTQHNINVINVNRIQQKL